MYIGGLLIATILLSSNLVFAEQISGKAHFIDADSIVVAGKTVRLHGIDAPEIAQQCQTANRQSYPCGKVALAYLRKIAGSRRLTCLAGKRDRYNRTIAICNAGKTDINREMVRSGHAVAYIRYSKDYLMDQLSAKRHRRGLWSGTFQMPWKYRARQGRTRH